MGVMNKHIYMAITQLFSGNIVLAMNIQLNKHKGPFELREWWTRPSQMVLSIVEVFPQNCVRLAEMLCC